MKDFMNIRIALIQATTGSRSRFGCLFISIYVYQYLYIGSFVLMIFCWWLCVGGSMLVALCLVFHRSDKIRNNNKINSINISFLWLYY